MLSSNSRLQIIGGRVKITEQFIESRTARKSWGAGPQRKGVDRGGGLFIRAAGFFRLWRWSRYAVLSWSVGGGIWGGAAIVGGVTGRRRAGPEPAREIRAVSGVGSAG